MSKKKQPAAPTYAAVPGWPKSPIDQANYERDIALERLQALQIALKPFQQDGWAGSATPDSAPVTLTVTAGDMRWLNMSVGDGYALPRLRRDAELGRKVKEMPLDTALWNADGAWHAGRWDGAQWIWEREIAAELALDLLHTEERAHGEQG